MAWHPNFETGCGTLFAYGHASGKVDGSGKPVRRTDNEWNSRDPMDSSGHIDSAMGTGLTVGLGGRLCRLVAPSVAGRSSDRYHLQLADRSKGRLTKSSTENSQTPHVLPL